MLKRKFVSNREFKSESVGNAVAKENTTVLGWITKSPKCHAKEFALDLAHNEKQSFLKRRMD